MSLAKTIATTVPWASWILTRLELAIIVYVPAGKVFPETENWNGTWDWTPPDWAFAGITTSAMTEPRHAASNICFFMKFLLFRLSARLASLALADFCGE